MEAVRRLENALGDGEKTHTALEAENRVKVRRSIVARCAMASGVTIAASMLDVRRPGGGIGPEHWDQVVGSVTRRDVTEEAVLGPGDLVGFGGE